MENAIFFKIPENDVNRVHKEIAVEILGLVGSGKPKDELHFFAQTVGHTIRIRPVAWTH